jgi:dTDP-4-dehydrorhamnose reductase
MFSVAVLGSSGMIGHEVSNHISQRPEFTVFNYQRNLDNKKNNVIQFDILKQNKRLIADEFKKFDYIINCTGVIKHLIDPMNDATIENIRKVNTEFPRILSTALENSNSRVIEIGTDCVFKGDIGNYTENSKKDATDLYGISKKMGEFESENVMRIRTSVIGLEVDRSVELLSWFLAKENQEVGGFTNHLWNGITSFHLGKIIRAIITDDLFASGTQHFYPSDKVSKYTLLEIVKDVWDRQDINLKPLEAENKIDRTLDSLDKNRIKNLWRAGGYIEIPSVRKLVEEYYLRVNSVYN